MKKQIKQIRDIREIEKQLMQAQSGVLCIHLDSEKLLQFACNFVYLDKNIYTYLDSTDEEYEHVKYGAWEVFQFQQAKKLIGSQKILLIDIVHNHKW